MESVSKYSNTYEGHPKIKLHRDWGENSESCKKIFLCVQWQHCKIPMCLPLPLSHAPAIRLHLLIPLIAKSVPFLVSKTFFSMIILARTLLVTQALFEQFRRYISDHSHYSLHLSPFSWGETLEMNS